MQLIREAKMRMEMSEREASLRRARQQASMADGVSWGMGEDAIEEEEVIMTIVSVSVVNLSVSRFQDF